MFGFFICLANLSNFIQKLSHLLDTFILISLNFGCKKYKQSLQGLFGKSSIIFIQQPLYDIEVFKFSIADSFVNKICNVEH